MFAGQRNLLARPLLVGSPHRFAHLGGKPGQLFVLQFLADPWEHGFELRLQFGSEVFLSFQILQPDIDSKRGGQLSLAEFAPFRKPQFPSALGLVSLFVIILVIPEKEPFELPRLGIVDL